MRFIYILIIAVVLLGCKKKDPPAPPESAQLIFPEKNSECTIGEDINANTRMVEFRWQAANNAESYELVVTNLDNSNKQDVTVKTTSAKLPIAKGTPFSWVVISKNTAVVQTASSATWNFYNAGFETTYAPFPAEIIAPEIGSSVFRDINNEIELSWSGDDLDGDIESYEIYFSTENPPENLVFSTGPNVSARKLSVDTNTVYYWKVVTKDREGNTSDSGVFDFRVY